MVDGDFKKFDGKWSVKSGTRYNFFPSFLKAIVCKAALHQSKDTVCI